MMRHDDEMQPRRKPQTFDAAAHLRDEETIRAYLQAALDDPTPGALWRALDNVAKGRERNSEGK
jgi:DNA-binding phage protein